MMGYDEHEIFVPVPPDEIGGLVNVSDPPPLDPVDMMPMPAVFDQMYDWSLQRIAQVGKYPKAREMLMQRWPEHLPSPKKITTDDQLTTLLDLLDAVEKQHSLPFVPSGLANGKHMSELPLSNTHHHTKGAMA
jgi:hypothetical protein